MTAQHTKPQRIWAVAEQQPAPAPPRKPMGQWLVENMPRGIDLEIPSRRDSGREIPFITQDC